MFNYYLVQLGQMRNRIAVKKAGTILKSVDWDYMGSAEFEFGALPKALGCLLSTQDELVIVDKLLFKGYSQFLTAVVRTSQVQKLKDFLSNFNDVQSDLKERILIKDTESVLFGIDEGLEFIVTVGNKKLKLLMDRGKESFELLQKNEWIDSSAKINPLFIS